MAVSGANERSGIRAQNTQPDGRSVWDVRERLDESFRRVETLLGEMETLDDPKLRLAVAGEIRQHIALAEKTLESASRAEAVRAFEETVMTALEEASSRVRRKVMAALRARGANGDSGEVPEVILSEAGDEVRE